MAQISTDVIIVGAGRIGMSLANWLIGLGHEIAVIDTSLEKCNAIDDELGAITVVGDGTEAGVLAKAGANRAQVLIASTRADDVNLVACQLAKHRFGVAQTITVIENPEYQRLFEQLGIGLVVNATDMIVGKIQSGLDEALAELAGEQE